MWYVYIVQGKSGALYTGITTDVERRVEEHNTSPKGAKWTRAQRPVKLVWQTEVENRSKAMKLEYKIKSLSRKKKLEMIECQ